MVLRSSRTLPGQLWFWNICRTLSPTPATLRPCFVIHVSQQCVHQLRNVFFVVAQWRQVDVENVEPVIKIAAQFALGHRLFRNFVGGRQHPHVHRRFYLAAQAAQLAVFQHAQQLGLGGGGHLADFIQQQRAFFRQFKAAGAALQAPVNAPFSWPKISLSISVSGMAEQLMATNGLFLRGLSSWMVRATISLPVPLSPVISTDAVLGATISTRWKISCIAREPPTIWPKRPVSRSLRLGGFQFHRCTALAGGILQDLLQPCWDPPASG